MRYPFHSTPELCDLVLEVQHSSEGLLFDVSGPGSEFFAALIKPYFDWLNKIGPIGTFNGSNVYSLYLPPIPSEPHSRMVEGFLNTFFFRRPTPQAVTISVTDKCQCQCFHCSAAAYRSSRPTLSGKEIKRIAAESIALGVNNVTFTGGDPLLRKDLETLVCSVPSEKAVVQVFTNGLGLDGKRAASLKAAGVYGVQVSLDSPNSDEHDRLRKKKGTFLAVKNGVRAARDVGLLIGLSTYATRESIRERKLSRLTALAAEWGVHEVSVFDVIPTGRLLHSDSLILDKESRLALMEEARVLNKGYNNRPRVVTQSWTNSGTGFARSFGCLAGNYQFHVSAYGDFTPCDFTPLSFGSVRTQPIAALWEKITTHPAYCKHRDDCRMQSPDFRKQYIRSIPEHAGLPFPIEELKPPTETS